MCPHFFADFFWNIESEQVYDSTQVVCSNSTNFYAVCFDSMNAELSHYYQICRENAANWTTVPRDHIGVYSKFRISGYQRKNAQDYIQNVKTQFTPFFFHFQTCYYE